METDPSHGTSAKTHWMALPGLSVWRLEQTLGTTKDDAAHTPFEYAPCYPVRVPGLNDGSLLSELETYDELMRMEQETNVLETRLNKLVDDLDDFG